MTCCYGHLGSRSRPAWPRRARRRAAAAVRPWGLGTAWDVAHEIGPGTVGLAISIRCIAGQFRL